jgi:hypothetical protein
MGCMILFSVPLPTTKSRLLSLFKRWCETYFEAQLVQSTILYLQSVLWEALPFAIALDACVSSSVIDCNRQIATIAREGLRRATKR